VTFILLDVKSMTQSPKISVKNHGHKISIGV